MELKADLHVHTSVSNDGVHDLAKMIDAAEARGLSAIAVSDHNVSYVSSQSYKGKVILIPACEVTTKDGHILGLFLNSSLDIIKLNKNGYPTGRMAVEEIHAKGGIAVAAHPFHKVGRFEKKPDLYQYVDAIEVANARAFFKNPKANEQALAYAKEHGMPITGGSDAHSKYEIGNAYTVLNCESMDLQSLKDAIIKGKNECVLLRNTPRRRKGISQLYRACREKRPYDVCRSIVYVVYCTLLDIRKK